MYFWASSKFAPYVLLFTSAPKVNVRSMRSLRSNKLGKVASRNKRPFSCWKVLLIYRWGRCAHLPKTRLDTRHAAAAAAAVGQKKPPAFFPLRPVRRAAALRPTTKLNRRRLAATLAASRGGGGWAGTFCFAQKKKRWTRARICSFFFCKPASMREFLWRQLRGLSYSASCACGEGRSRHLLILLWSSTVSPPYSVSGDVLLPGR